MGICGGLMSGIYRYIGLCANLAGDMIHHPRSGVHLLKYIVIFMYVLHSSGFYSETDDMEIAQPGESGSTSPPS